MHSVKTERITARVSEQIKDTLMTAADIMGSTLNQFLIQAAIEKAGSVIENNQIVYLSEKDSQVFFDALDNPPKANKNLQQALKSYNNKIEKTCS